MPLYDLMLLLDPGAPSDRQETILRDVQGLIESGGTLVGSYDWGTRRMTFEIDHRPEAAYHLFQFETEGGGALLERVDHSLKIMDGVLRHRIIRLKDGSPPPPTPAPDRRGGWGEHDAETAEAPPADAAPSDVAVEEPTAPEEAPAEEQAPRAEAAGDDEAPSGPTAA
jgi:small subunit ribosomal protein S6